MWRGTRRDPIGYSLTLMFYLILTFKLIEYLQLYNTVLTAVISEVFNWSFLWKYFSVTVMLFIKYTFIRIYKSYSC